MRAWLLQLFTQHVSTCVSVCNIINSNSMRWNDAKYARFACIFTFIHIICAVAWCCFTFLLNILNYRDISTQWTHCFTDMSRVLNCNHAPCLLSAFWLRVYFSNCDEWIWKKKHALKIPSQKNSLLIKEELQNVCVGIVSILGGQM